MKLPAPLDIRADRKRGREGNSEEGRRQKRESEGELGDGLHARTRAALHVRTSHRERASVRKKRRKTCLRALIILQNLVTKFDILTLANNNTKTRLFTLR